MDNLINMRYEYKDYLRDTVYSKEYDIHIHSLQTALTILGYASLENVDINSMQYGYFDVNTENMIRGYQEDREYYVDGKITEKLWEEIFDELVRANNCMIVKTGPKQISIYDIDKMLYDNDKLNKLSEDLASKINLNTQYPDIVLDDSMWPSVNGGEFPSINGEQTLYWDGDYVTDGGMIVEGDSLYNLDGGKTLPLLDNFIPSGGKNFDDVVYEYLVNGGKLYTDTEYSYNINGGNNWNTEYLSYNVNGGSDRDYDYISNLLSNTIFEGAIQRDEGWKSKSSANGIGEFKGSFYKSNNYPYFYPTNIDQLKRSKFDIQIVYGPKAEFAKKIIEVTPMSVTQEINASGEPIYDMYEFIAKDVVISRH